MTERRARFASKNIGNVLTAARQASDVDGVLAMAAFVALVINPALVGREGDLTPLPPRPRRRHLCRAG
jgi:hypothetical protein